MRPVDDDDEREDKTFVSLPPGDDVDGGQSSGQTRGTVALDVGSIRTRLTISSFVAVEINTYQSSHMIRHIHIESP